MKVSWYGCELKNAIFVFPDEEPKAEELEVCIPIQWVSHRQSQGQHSVPGSRSVAVWDTDLTQRQHFFVQIDF